MVGGGGPRRTPSLAGRYADEFNHGLASADEIGPKIATMRAAAEEAGRDPGAITVSVMGPVVTGADPGAYRAVLEATARAVGRPPERIEERWKAAGLPIGTPEEVRETIASLERVGVEKLYLQHLDLTDLCAAGGCRLGARGLRLRSPVPRRHRQPRRVPMGSMGKTVSGVPPAAHTTSCRRSPGSATTGTGPG